MCAWHAATADTIAWNRLRRCCSCFKLKLSCTLLLQAHAEFKPLGSGPLGGLMSGGPFCCCWDECRPDGVCSNRASPDISCRRCGLVSYCSEACKAAHATQHATQCNSRLAEPVFVPSYLLESRRPSWMTGDEQHSRTFAQAHRPREFLWGNLPAHNLLQAALTGAEAAAGGMQQSTETGSEAGGSMQAGCIVMLASKYACSWGFLAASM